jgi:hypothetical protein
MNCAHQSPTKRRKSDDHRTKFDRVPLAESGPKAHKLPKVIEDNEILERLTSSAMDGRYGCDA